MTEFQESMIGSCFLLGAFIGSFILPRLADVFGRKPLFIVGLVLYIISVYFLLVSTNKTVMYSMLVLGGVSETGRYYVAYVYAVEIFSKQMQSNAGLTIFIAFDLCKVLICLYFMLSTQKNWKVMAYISLTLAILSLLLTLFRMPESPRFLYSQKKHEQANQVLRGIQRRNKKNLAFSFDLKAHYEEQQTFQASKDKEEQQINALNDLNPSMSSANIDALQLREDVSRKKKESEMLAQARDESKLEGNFSELCGVKVYARNLTIMMVVWSFGSFAFFMVPFYLKNVKANIYYLSLATELAEFLATATCAIISKYMDLKRALFYSCTLIAAGAFFMIFIASKMADDEEAQSLSREATIFNSCLILLTNYGIVLAFDIAYLINAQLFPTILLATAYGCCNILGRLISISSPIVANLPQPYPLVILIVFAFVSGFLSLFLIKIK
mmetsp:Transcript_14781/g.25151  ORF Transcript_14781/g.25151 Transcript_14781/m.25151 type:complete len:441 (-) Transcript_14781:54-1376(-)